MKQFIPLLFFITFLSILISANIYLARRFSYFFEVKKAWMLYVFFASATVFMIGSMVAFTNATSGFANVAYSTATVMLGFLLFLLLSVIVIDLMTVFLKIPPKTWGIMAISMAAIISILGIRNATNHRIRKIEVPLPGLKQEIKAALLTDIHIGHFWGAKTLQKVVDKTNAQNPDVIFITGDLFDGRIRLSEASLSPLQGLNAPVYFVEGNHDGYSGAQEIKQKLRQISVRVLENEIAQFSELQIIGLNYMSADDESFNMHASEDRANIKNTLNKLNILPDKPTVMLHHSPEGIKYANLHGVDLYLAGHTHAGQIFPITFIAKAMFDYNQGLHNYNDTQIYVSQGVGTFGPPMRIGTISEITILNLKPEKQP